MVEPDIELSASSCCLHPGHVNMMSIGQVLNSGILTLLNHATQRERKIQNIRAACALEVTPFTKFLLVVNCLEVNYSECCRASDFSPSWPPFAWRAFRMLGRLLVRTARVLRSRAFPIPGCLFRHGRLNSAIRWPRRFPV